VRLGGKDCYLGKYGTAAARYAYDQLIRGSRDISLSDGLIRDDLRPSLLIASKKAAAKVI
jgi:hypothetical protein